MGIITSEIAEELKVEFGKKYYEKLINSNIQIFANHFIFQYQWRDLSVDKYKETSNNESFDSRGELKEFIKKYLDKL